MVRSLGAADPMLYVATQDEGFAEARQSHGRNSSAPPRLRANHPSPSLEQRAKKYDPLVLPSRLDCPAELALRPGIKLIIGSKDGMSRGAFAIHHETQQHLAI